MHVVNYYRILANSSEEQVCHLASLVLQAYPTSQLKLLSGPQRGLVMLRVLETVANSQFNAGEILVTEVKLELDGQFGYGMVLGDSPRRAMATALVDAALRQTEKSVELVGQLEQQLTELDEQLHLNRQHTYQAVATTKVDFEVL